ncbi:MAG: YbjN domain-containing protein [Pseudomonadota bacterium]
MMIKSLFKFAAPFFLASTAALGLAVAQSNSLSAPKAPVKNPSQPLNSLHAEAIIPLLSELGIQYQGATMPNGQKAVLAQAENGIKFQLTPMACDEGNKRCRGLNMVAIFQTSASSRTVSAFNYRYAFVSAGLDDSGAAYITRYDIADYGMPRGNLAVSILNYLHMAAVFDQHLYEATSTVRVNATDSDLAATGLNMRSILADTSLATSLGLSSGSHTVSFEEVSGVVDAFVKADNLAPGRLINQVKGQR